MTPGADRRPTLDQLLALSVKEREQRLAAQCDARGALMSLADEAERLALQEVSRAMAASRMVVELADAIGGARERARCRRARAQACAYAGRHEEALVHANEAREIAEQGGEAVEAARAMAIALHPLGELGRYDEAVRIGEEARAALLAAGEPRLAARADFNLGGIHQNRDDPEKALFHLDRAAPVFDDDPVITGYLNNNRGEALLLLNDFLGAEDAFQRALDACERTGMNLAAAIAEGNLADLAARRGQLQRALFHFERARRRFESDRAESHLARLLAEQAEALGTLGLVEVARAAYEDVLPKLEARGLAWEVARARAGLSRCYARLNRLSDADHELFAAAQAFGALGHSLARARSQLARAEIAAAREDFALADSLLSEAREGIGARPLDLAVLGRQAAALALRRGDFREAGAQLESALSAATSLQLAPLLADLLHTRSQLWRVRGAVGQALADLRQAKRHVERVRGALQAERFRAAYLGDRLRIYEDFVQTALDAHSDDGAGEALHAIEQAKSRSLLEMTRRWLDEDEHDAPATEDSAETELREASARLRSELNALYSQLADARHLDRSPQRLAEIRAAMERRENELDHLDTRLAASRGAANLYAAPASREEIQRSLAPGAALIEYFSACDETLAIVLTRDRVSVFRRLGSPAELAARVDRFRFQCNRAARPGATEGARGARLVADAQRELHQLWRLLMAPLAPALLDVEAIHVAPHGPLHLVPFHALWDGGGYLAQRYPFSYAPSASLKARLATRPARPVRRPVVVGVPDALAPRMSDEASRISATLGGEPLLDERATVAAVQAAVRSADVVHLACHGQFSADNPSSSGLRLADRWLTAAEIFELQLQAELVTLSGCNTGRNVVHAGDELHGLLRGFFAAGADAVLASLWPVHDEFTSDFMCDFYETWRRAETARGAKAAALREAQLRAAAARPHPLYWAPFVLVGA